MRRAILIVGVLLCAAGLCAWHRGAGAPARISGTGVPARTSVPIQTATGGDARAPRRESAIADIRKRKRLRKF